MFAVPFYRAQHRAVFAVFEHVSIQQIGKYEIAIPALNKKPECVSRVFPNCASAIDNTNNVIQALTLTGPPHSKSSSPGSEFGSEFGDTAQDDFEAATSQPTSCTIPIFKDLSHPSIEGRSSASPGTEVFSSPENEASEEEHWSSSYTTP